MAINSHKKMLPTKGKKIFSVRSMKTLPLLFNYAIILFRVQNIHAVQANEQHVLYLTHNHLLAALD